MESLENYLKEKRTIDLVKANIFGLVIIVPAILLFGLPYYFLWKNEPGFSELKNIFDPNNPFSAFFLFIKALLILIAGIVAHELIHGVVWAFFTRRGFRSVSFGIFWKLLTPYCHCKEPLRVKHYVLGAMMPALLLGIAPAIYAIFYGHLGFLLFGIFFTIAAAGDFIVIWLLRNENRNSWVEDHPSEAGCFVYRNRPNDLPEDL